MSKIRVINSEKQNGAEINKLVSNSICFPARGSIVFFLRLLLVVLMKIGVVSYDHSSFSDLMTHDLRKEKKRNFVCFNF
jgi:hypothetical protein